MDAAISKNGVPIRLTEERWFHIVETHDEMAGRYDEVLSAIELPDYIIQGYGDALVALKLIGKKDGFVIAAFLTNKIQIEKEVVLWEKKS
jgi:hypothetical protein